MNLTTFLIFWQVFSEDIKLVRIEAIISELIDMYDMETKVKPQTVTENSNKAATDSLSYTATSSNWRICTLSTAQPLTRCGKAILESESSLVGELKLLSVSES